MRVLAQCLWGKCVWEQTWARMVGKRCLILCTISLGMNKNGLKTQPQCF